jgi:hypothetical protein
MNACLTLDNARSNGSLRAAIILVAIMIHPLQFISGEVACFVAMAQTPQAQAPSFDRDLQIKLDRYYEANIPLILDMHFNQPSYSPGDTAWFSLWLSTEKEGLPPAGRQVIHVDLATRQGDIISRQFVLINNGVATSQLLVPRNISSGVYTVVAWTDWMKNDDPALFCYKTFTVLGERQVAQGPMALRAFPEGGVLVPEIENNVVVTGPPSVNIKLMSGGAVMQSVTLNPSGYGRLRIIPQPQSAYVITDGKQTNELKLTQAGVAMNLNCNDSASTVSVELRDKQRRRGSHLAMVSRGKVVYSAMIGFDDDDRALINVPRKILPEGLIVATVFDDQNQVLSERVFVANTPGEALMLSSDAPAAHPRERVSLSVASKGETFAPLTVSVYAEDLFAQADNSTQPVFSGSRLPFGALDFKIDEAWSLRNWNSFMVTQSWKRFDWTDVWNGRTERIHPFTRYLKFVGKVVLLEENASFDSVRITFFLRSEARIYEQYVDRSGQFDVDLFFDFDNEEEIIYTIDQKGRVLKDATIVLSAEADPLFNFSVNAIAARADKYVAFAQLRETSNAAYGNYKVAATALASDDANDRVEDELFEADVTVKLDDYLIFPTMEETLREIVPRLQHRWRAKHHRVTVALSEPDELAKDDPLYFIDGVLTDDTDYFMGLDPRNVETIKVISSRSKLRAMGVLGQNGIVLVTTRLIDNYRKVPRTHKRFTSIGFTRSVTFNNMPKQWVRTPSLRSSIYFNPVLKLDANGKTSFEVTMPDNTGTFRAEVVGMSNTGSVYRAVTRVRSVPPASVH